jgi:hypothetical protein
VNNAQRILAALDSKLDGRVELTLYGRAAIVFGFEEVPKELAQSRDVDGVLWLGQAEEMARTTNFWEAVAEVNKQFRQEDLYISHLFEEDQLILTSQWKKRRVQVSGPWHKLIISRLSNEDLFLTKMMRDDPQDVADARLIVERAGWDERDIEAIVSTARVPDLVELRDEFARATAHFLTFQRGRKDRVALGSAAIASVTYDPEKRRLDVEFRGGGTYRYFKVPLSIYRALLKAESAGAFWNEVKEDFTYVKVAD